MLSALELRFAPITSCKMRVKLNVWSCDRFDVLKQHRIGVLHHTIVRVMVSGDEEKCDVQDSRQLEL